MYVYQEEEGQVGLIFGVVIQKRDMEKIRNHDPVNFSVGQLKINISFCMPSKPVSFEVESRTYFISLDQRYLWFLREGNTLVTVHTIEGVPFILLVSFERDKGYTEESLIRQIDLNQYILLRGSESWQGL